MFLFANDIYELHRNEYVSWTKFDNIYDSNYSRQELPDDFPPKMRTVLNCVNMFSWQGRNGEDIQYGKYFYDKYGVTIKQPAQPLLVSMPRDRQRRRDGTFDDKPVNLVPELCQMTGLSDDQRANFKLMSVPDV